MKNRLLALFLAAAALSVLAGCNYRTVNAAEDAVENKLDAMEENVENKLDAIEDSVEQKTSVLVPPLSSTDLPQSHKPEPLPEAPKTPKADVPVEVPAQDKLSREEAERIALDHAGLSAAEVSRLHTEYDVDDRVPEYEVEFRSGRLEYQYEIHAENGTILKAERETDD